MLTSKEILSKIECGKKDKFKSFQALKDYPLSTQVGIKVKDFIQKELKMDNMGNSNIGDFKLEEGMFPNKETYEAYKNRALMCLSYFVFVFKGFKNLKYNVKKEIISKKGEKLLLEADIVCENQEGKVFALNFYFKKPLLTMSGKNRVEDSKEAMLLWLLATEIAGKDKGAYGGMFYMIPSGSTLSKMEKFDVKKQIFFNDFSNIKERGYYLDLFFSVENMPDCITTINCDGCKYNFFCNYKEEVKGKIIQENTEKPMFNVDDSQLKVCLFDEGYARVIAGPGSGKTKTITSRFSYLISSGVKPKEILLITYTNAAANEMKERITQSLMMDGVKVKDEDLNITTFHGLGYKIICENFKFFGYKEPPKQINKVEKYKVLKEVYDNIWGNLSDVVKGVLISSYQGLNPVVSNKFSKGFLNLVEEDISKIKLGLVNPNPFFGDNFAKNVNLSNSTDTLLEFYKAYSKYLKENSLVDYDDLIKSPLTAVKYDFELYKFLPNIKHIFVDEFQDSNLEQINILKSLIKGESFKSLMVVGDPSQAIYGFNGTSPENFKNLNELLEKDVSDFYLSTNYRSTEEIIALSEIVERNQSNFIPKSMKSLKSGYKPSLVICNEFDCAIANTIFDEHQNGRAFKDIAVIARTRTDLKKIENALSDLKIPFVYGINELVCFNDFLEPISDFGEALMNFNESGYFKLLAMTGDLEPTDSKEKMKKVLDTFVHKVNGELIIKDGKATNKSLNEVFLKNIKRIKDKRIATYVVEKQKEFPFFKDLIDYLKETILYKGDEILEAVNEGTDAVTLTTAHSAKGREWESVHLILNSFKIPYLSKNPSKKRIEDRDEEIRVLYVGLTRPKENMYLYSNKENEASSIIRLALEQLKLSKKKRSVI